VCCDLGLQERLQRVAVFREIHERDQRHAPDGPEGRATGAAGRCNNRKRSAVTNPSDMPTPPASEPGAAATQLSILLSAATAAVDEEFKRSERLDAKSRNQVTVAGTWFAVAQAVVVGLVNGTLGSSATNSASAFVPWLAAMGGVAALLTAVATLVSYNAWRLRDDPALSIDTIRAYRDFARAGNAAVGVKLVSAYADVASGRRANNAFRAKAVDRAAGFCGLAMLVVSLELLLAFVAVATR
jgi:hypothetical protein